MASLPELIPWVAQFTGVMERTETAEWAAAAVLSFPTCEPAFATIAKGGLGLLAVDRGDIEATRERYSALESHGGVMVRARSVPSTAYWGCYRTL